MPSWGRDLPNLDLDGPEHTNTASDPICAVFCNGIEIGRTEFYKDCPSPIFKQTFEILYRPNEEQMLAFEVWDIDLLGPNKQAGSRPSFPRPAGMAIPPASPRGRAPRPPPAPKRPPPARRRSSSTPTTPTSSAPTPSRSATSSRTPRPPSRRRSPTVPALICPTDARPAHHHAPHMIIAHNCGITRA